MAKTAIRSPACCWIYVSGRIRFPPPTPSHSACFHRDCLPAKVCWGTVALELLFTARAQAIYLAKSRARAEATFRAFQARWRRPFASMVRRLAQDLPVVVLRLRSPPAAQVAHHQCDRALLCGGAPSHPAHGLLRKCRERGPYHLHFQRFNLEWKARTLSYLHKQLAGTPVCDTPMCNKGDPLGLKCVPNCLPCGRASGYDT